MINPEKIQHLLLLLKTAPAFCPTSPLPTPEQHNINTPADTEQGVNGMVVLPDDHPDTIASQFEEHGAVKHHYNRFDGWSIFSNGKYQRVEDPKEIRLHIRKFLSKCYITKKHRNQNGQIRQYKEKLKKQSSGFVSDILEALAALPDVHLLPSRKAPCSLDNSLNPAYTIATATELVDISCRPYKTQPLNANFYTLNYLDYPYNKNAFAEHWGEFLIDITQGDLDLMLLLQQWCGYLLLPTLKYQKFLLCVGDGANGKGVFFDTIAVALGRQNVSNVPLSRFDSPYAVFGTYGKLVNMSNESAATLESNSESLLKEFAAGDKILWEQKYRDAFFDYPSAKLMFATNELPKIRDVSDGIWRKLILVPFNAKFTGDKCNPNLARELQTPDELAGILNWMLEGAEILEKDGKFIEPEICKQALEQYRNESDSARLYLQEMVEPDPDNTCQIPCTWLHQQYQNWCDNNGFKAKNNVHFGQILKQIYCVQKSRPWFGFKKINVYLGIKPQEGSELSENFQKWTA